MYNNSETKLWIWTTWNKILVYYLAVWFWQIMESFCASVSPSIKWVIIAPTFCGSMSFTRNSAGIASNTVFDAFELRCWRILLRVPWTARRPNQSILKEINPEYSLEGLMLKLQYFGYLMRRADSLEKTLMMGKIEGRKIRGKQRVRLLDGITDSMDMSLG